jgi:acyl-coenzyme A synthetase/AMP-(fatty) acid ligase
MKMLPSDTTSDTASLRNSLNGILDTSGRWLWAADAAIRLSDLARGTSLGGRLPELAGKSVLITTAEQITAALALIELDGIVRRIVICPPDLPSEHLSQIVSSADVDAIVSDYDAPEAAGGPPRFLCTATLSPADRVPRGGRCTEWVLLTSGTTGVPKMVAHTLAGLTGAIKPGGSSGAPVVWGTFYDIRRFGGLQIFLRAMLCGGSLVLSSAHEAVGDHLQRLGARGVTHLSGTPSHWRRALMSPAVGAIAPRYVRLSGEIADQAILDQLGALLPQASVAHAYASTEAGVGFDVDDGRAGFPAGIVGPGRGDVEMKVLDGSLRIRSSRVAGHYVGHERAELRDAEGFVDTRDMVELRGDRYYFVGRRDGIINVGGLKVHPEEVEAVINRHPGVQMSLVRSRRNPITGEIVVADVLLRAAGDGAGERAAELKREIMQCCRAGLAEHKVPAAIRFVAALDVNKSGKLARSHA